jgi:hypothetical protein
MTSSRKRDGTPPGRAILFAVIRASILVLACLLTGSLAGCGSSGNHTTTTSAVAKSPLPSLKSCFEKRGYTVDVESPQVRGTAPKEFEFVAVWNLVNPDPTRKRIALAITVSKTRDGAARAAAWLRKTNKRIAKGVVRAPVVQFDKLNVLWTTDPATGDTHDIYGCVRKLT